MSTPNEAPLDKLFLCTTCFSLTSKGTTSQRCQCEPFQRIHGLDCPSGYHLCYICSARVAGGTSRWSHEACPICLDANTSLAKEGIRLPLGRHSVMNGIAIPFTISQECFKELVGEMVGFVNVMTLLSELSKQRAITLYLTETKWLNVRFIPVRQWGKPIALAVNEERKKSKEIIKAIVSHCIGGKNI